MNSNPTFKNRFLVSALVFAVLLVGIILLIGWPALQEIRLIRTQVYEERVRLEKLYVRGQLQKKVRDNYAKIQDEISFLDNILLKENQELQYITAVEQAAVEQNVGLKINIGESKRAPESPLSTLAVNFELNGRWTDILRTLERLEAIPYYTNIKETSVAVHEPQPGTPATATVSISADTYWLLP